MGFISIAGIVCMLPLVLMSRITPLSLIAMIGVMIACLLGFGVFYAVISDYTLIQVLMMEGKPAGWPSRAIGTPYILIMACLVLLPVAVVVKIVRGNKPNKNSLGDAKDARQL